MAGTTPIYNWPYPTGGDPVAQGDNDIMALALDVENTLSAGAWQAFTPSFVNIVVGDGTVDGRYTVIGGTLFVRVRLTFGSTSSVSLNPVMVLPGSYTIVSPPSSSIIGQLVMVDATGSEFYGVVRAAGTGLVSFYAIGVGATYATMTQMTNNIPMTWAVNDVLEFAFAVEVS